MRKNKKNKKKNKKCGWVAGVCNAAFKGIAAE